MLLQLLPRDIAKHWGGISEAISKSLPPITPRSVDRMSFILKSLIAGIMQCWVLHKPKGEMYAIVTTEFAVDPGSQTKNLLIFSLFGLGEIPSEMWKQCYSTLCKFAKANGCSSLVAFADDGTAIETMKEYGWNTDTKLLIMGVDNVG